MNNELSGFVLGCGAIIFIWLGPTLPLWIPIMYFVGVLVAALFSSWHESHQWRQWVRRHPIEGLEE